MALKLLKFSLFPIVLVFIICFSYIEFKFAPYSSARFKFSDTKTLKIYEPLSVTGYGMQGRRSKVNKLGFIGDEFDKYHYKKTLLSLGTCTALEYYDEIKTFIKDDNLNVVYMSGAMGHLTIREVLLQGELLFNESFKPDYLLIPVATVFVRDIEFYNKDIYAAPHSIVEERAFNYREGGWLDWFEFNFKRRKNQLYFSSDRDEIEPYLLNQKKQTDFNPTKTIEKNLKAFSDDLVKLSQFCKKHGIKLITHTPPFHWSIMSERQKKILKRFSDKIHVLSKEKGFEVIDLSTMKEVQHSDNYVYDLVHLSPKGSKIVGAIIYKHLKEMF